MNRLINNARQLALCIVDSEWKQDSLREKLDYILDGGPPDPNQLAGHLILLDTAARSPRFKEIVQTLIDNKGFSKHFSGSRRVRIQPGETKMQALPSPLSTLSIPKIPNLRHLAQWLGLSDNELEWFAGLNRRYSSTNNTKLNHYHYEWRDRRAGYPRLLEKPKLRLKSLQKEILTHILNRIPLHESAHGFRRHRSCRTSVLPHVGSQVLLKMDLQDFFLSVSRARVEGIFRMIGYPGRVASCLAGICTHRSARQLCGDKFSVLPVATRKRFMEWHLPQGAPTSPALANLCAWRLDNRLSGLGNHMGLAYTRYADDMAFSGNGNLYHQKRFIEPLIGAIAQEEGFCINFRKTHWMRASQRQQVFGIVLNRHPNLNRQVYDQLKALLHNCIRFGPASQNVNQHPNFRQHLEGRVSHAKHLNQHRGKKLEDMLKTINWD